MLALTRFPTDALPQSTPSKSSLRDDLLRRAHIKTLDFHKVRAFQKAMKKCAMQEISPFWADHPLIARVFAFHLVTLMLIFSCVTILAVMSALFFYFFLDSQYLLASVITCTCALLLDWISLSALLNEGKFMHAAVHVSYVGWKTYSLAHYPYTIPHAKRILLEEVVQLGNVFIERLQKDPFAYIERPGERPEYVTCWDTNGFEESET